VFKGVAVYLFCIWPFFVAKSYFTHNFLRSVTFGVISTAEWLHSKPQTGGENDILESLV